jgi:hypothetical protein
VRLCSSPQPACSVRAGGGVFCARVGCLEKFFTDPDPGDKFEYRVARYNNDGHFHLLKCQADNGGNCNQFLETDWDPHNIWGGSESQFAGETFHTQPDIPGTADNKVTFSQIREKQPDDDQWIHGDLDYFNGGVEHYRFQFVDQHRHFRIWTYPVDR